MKRRSHAFKFELRIYQGEAAIKSNFITKISYQFTDYQRAAEANDANVEDLGLWMEPCEIELLLETAQMLKGMDYCYGQLVRLPCPAAGLPGGRLFEFRHAPEGTVVPSGFQLMYAPQIVAR